LIQKIITRRDKQHSTLMTHSLIESSRLMNLNESMNNSIAKGETSMRKSMHTTFMGSTIMGNADTSNLRRSVGF